MRFGPNVVEHAPFSIPMIGNTETGYVIGLTPEGAAVCHRMFTEDVPEQRSPQCMRICPPICVVAALSWKGRAPMAWQ